MKLNTIRHHESMRILYQTKAENNRQALTLAIHNQVNLDGADLRNKDLRNINLDGVHLKGAQFTNCDLTGANISEALFDNCDFSNARLTDSCLCMSQFQSCSFLETLFAATDISLTCFTNCHFSGPTFVSLNFYDQSYLENCFFHANDNTQCPLSKTPLCITGFNTPVMITDNHIVTRTKSYDFTAWKSALTHDDYRALKLPNSLIWHLIDIRNNPTRQIKVA